MISQEASLPFVDLSKHAYIVDSPVEWSLSTCCVIDYARDERSSELVGRLSRDQPRKTHRAYKNCGYLIGS